MAQIEENHATLLAISGLQATSYSTKETAEKRLSDLARQADACRQERKQLLDQTHTLARHQENQTTLLTISALLGTFYGAKEPV